MTLNEFFSSGYHLLTQQQMEQYHFNFFASEEELGIIGGLDTLEKVVKMKYGFSTLLPVTVAEIQNIVLSVLCMYREKYTHWWEFLKTNYSMFDDYKHTELVRRDNSITDNHSDSETKTNTGTQTNSGTNSETRTDNLTEQTTHGETITNAVNSYNSAQFKNSEQTTHGGVDSRANTGTQGTQGSASNTRTDNLSQSVSSSGRKSVVTDEDIQREISGNKKQPAELMMTELKLFQSNFLDNMSSDICSYITMFDFSCIGADVM